MALAPSPDLYDQFDQATGNKDVPFPARSANNVRLVPTAYNMYKRGDIDEIAQLHLLAIVESHQPGGEDVGGIAGVLCATVTLNAASNRRLILDVEEKASAAADLDRARQWLREGTGPAWVTTLPPSDLAATIERYDYSFPREAIEAVVEMLKGVTVKSDPLLVKNASGVCTLFFPATSSSEDIAEFIMCVLERMWRSAVRTMCGWRKTTSALCTDD